MDKLDKRPTNPIFWIFFIIAEICWISFIYFSYKAQTVACLKSGFGYVSLSLKYENYSTNSLYVMIGFFVTYMVISIFSKTFKKNFSDVVMLLMLRFVLVFLFFSLPIYYNS